MDPEHHAKDLLHLCALWHRLSDIYDSDYDPVGASVAITYRDAARSVFFLLCDQHGSEQVYAWDLEREEEPVREYIAELAAKLGIE